ncbi:hypothetical protein X943_001388 [Babesia divergens]|uniref:Uncharacterized protein n=1 Tax=Babesia divergens TaxID=32595 RepID=A0AAD9LH10_BABDI|nr:hypothetical protein X943_001388 [Babesia divergens]
MDLTSKGDKRKESKLIVTVDPTLMPPPYLNPYLRLFIYIAYILTSGCIYWGWNGLQMILYKGGAFEDLCVGAEGVTKKIIEGAEFIDCPARAGGINNLYTLAYATHFICSFVGGRILDQFGPRVCFLVGHAFTATAWVMVFCLTKYGNVLRAAFVIIGLFCEACYIPLLSVSMYFPNGNSTVMAVMGSCRSLSYLIPSLLAWIYYIDGVEQSMIAVIGVCYVLLTNVVCFVSGAFIVPKVLPIAPSDAAIEDNKEAYSTVNLDDAVVESATAKTTVLTNLKAAFKSKQLVEFIVLTCSACFFMPSIEFVNKSQGNLLVASGKGGDATHVFRYFNVLTFVPAPFLGLFMDKVGPAIVMNILHLCAVLYYVCVGFDIYAMKIAACCCFVMAGSLCVSTTYCYVNKRFPKQHFGTLVSIIFAFAGSAALTNIPIYNYGLTLTSAVPEQQFRPISYLFLTYMCIAYVCSAYLVYLSNFRGKKPVTQQGES